MNYDNKNDFKCTAQAAFHLKVGLFPMLLAIAALSGASSARAADECGPGPTVVCAVENYSSTGVTYDFSSDFDIRMDRSHRVGASGLRLNGSGDADLLLTTVGAITQTGGIQISLEDGNLTADIVESVVDVNGFRGQPGGTGLQVSTGGSATILLRGQPNAGSNENVKNTNLVMDVGQDSVVTVLARRTVQAMTLSPRAGATLTLDNNGGVLGTDILSGDVSDVVYIQGAGAGNLVIDNAGLRGRIAGAMDFSGMTGKLTLRNDNSGNTIQGGWHTKGANHFGSGEVEIHNGAFGVLRTTATTVLDFSDTIDSQFYNQGRVMVGAVDNITAALPRHLSFVGLDRFENSGLILLGTDFQVNYHQGLVTNAKAGDRLSFVDSHYEGLAGGRIAFDVLLADVVQSDCSMLEVSDCVQFAGSSTTDGTTLLDITDLDPQRSVAAFNPGIVLIEGASAAEHFILDPASQFYVGNSSGGPVLQKGMIAYRLQYDTDTRQHALVGTLADEALQAAMLGAAGQETWRVTTDTWFDRQEMLREARDGFDTKGLWATINVSDGNRSGQRTIDVAGTPTQFDIGQDQTISHLAFGVDLLHGSSGEQTWNGGVTAGLLYSSVDYDATRTQTTMAGMAGGVYGSWSSGGLSVDGMVNLNFMRQSVEGANFGLGAHNRLRTQVESLGLRLEAAWKLPVSDTLWVQPLVGISHVSVGEDDIELPDAAGGVRFDGDASSQRFGAGLRVGIDSRLAGLRTEYRLTARHWSEQDAENRVFIDIGGEPAPTTLTDDFGGGFNEVGGAVSIASESGALSASVNLKGRFGDDYRTLGGALGVRYAW